MPDATASRPERMRAPPAKSRKRKIRMNENLRREISRPPALRIEPNFECQTARDSQLRSRPIEPGYYLLRLRLRYGTKGARPLARLP
jgi:hypothetical protein